MCSDHIVDFVSVCSDQHGAYSLLLHGASRPPAAPRACLALAAVP